MNLNNKFETSPDILEALLVLDQILDKQDDGLWTSANSSPRDSN